MATLSTLVTSKTYSDKRHTIIFLHINYQKFRTFLISDKLLSEIKNVRNFWFPKYKSFREIFTDLFFWWKSSPAFISSPKLCRYGYLVLSLCDWLVRIGSKFTLCNYCFWNFQLVIMKKLPNIGKNKEKVLRHFVQNRPKYWIFCPKFSISLLLFLYSSTIENVLYTLIIAWNAEKNIITTRNCAKNCSKYQKFPNILHDIL